MLHQRRLLAANLTGERDGFGSTDVCLPAAAVSPALATPSSFDSSESAPALAEGDPRDLRHIPPVDDRFQDDGWKDDDGGDDFQTFDLSVPAYSSLPEAPKKIYLDFDGEEVRNSSWNYRTYHNGYNTGEVIDAPPYSTDGNLGSFSSSERTRIREIWARVAEDFRPFYVDVTTIEPPEELFTAGNQAIRVLISTNVDATTGEQWYPVAGGVAYLRSWTYRTDTPVWVFENHLGNGNEKYVAEAASHEVGHAYNLRHDGNGGSAYYRGHGSGEAGWAPLMGVGYYRRLSQWSQGEYTGANQDEDDLAKIASYVPYRDDDHGDAPATATELEADASGAVSAGGIITTRVDVDAFAFSTRSGEVSFTVEPFELADGKANLDVGLTLFDGLGSEVASASPIDDLDATLTVELAAGSYTLLVDGVGRPATEGHEGYSDYGSLGQYELSGSIVLNAPPLAEDDFVGTLVNNVRLFDVLANDSDPDDDAIEIASVGAPQFGTAVLIDGLIEYSPPTDFLGIDTFTYTVEDANGATDEATVTVEVVEPPRVESLQIDDGTGQRSMLRSLTVVFDRSVTIDPAAVLLERRGDPGEAIDVELTTSEVDGQTVATLTFVPGDHVEESGSLADGNYQLTLLALGIEDLYGIGFDGDEDSQPGGDFLFGTSDTDDFFRLFGDVNGDESTDFTDFLALRTAYGDAGEYRDDLDFDLDENVDFTDFLAFRERYGQSIPFA
jgi:uncharacterized protein YdeI (BOF family)